MIFVVAVAVQTGVAAVAASGGISYSSRLFVVSCEALALYT